VVAANYGGRWDITRAARRLAREVADGHLEVQKITSDSLYAQMCLHEFPEPDLFIRTGGEQRISNFLLWQLAYSELYFTNRLWPDFDAEALDEALTSFATRQRRFGLTSEQLETGGHGEDNV
jgi:undecaprenyl diphosphate synthase